MAVSNKSPIKLGAVISIFAVLVVVLTFVLYISRANCGQNSDVVTHPIPYKRLSDEKNFPFYILKRPLSYWKDKDPYYNEYRASVAHFPDVRACLVDSELDKQTPNLNNFDWGKIKRLTDAEVCAWRVLSSIGTLEGSKQWLEGQGFNKFSSLTREGPDTRLQAIWSRECGNRYEEPWNWSRAIHDMLIDADFYLTVVSTDNEVSSVNGGFNSK